jgi:hypothetical protein
MMEMGRNEIGNDDNTKWAEVLNIPSFRRVYFFKDKLVVVKTPQNFLYIFIPSITLITFVLRFVEQWGLGFPIEMFIAGTCGAVGAGIGYGINIYKGRSFDKRINVLSPEQMVKLNKKNFMINHSDITNIRLKYNPETIEYRNAQLHIESTDKNYDLIIVAKYVKDIVINVEQINRYKAETRVQLTTKIDHVSKLHGE